MKRTSARQLPRPNTGQILVDVLRSVWRGDVVKDAIMIIMSLTLVSCLSAPIPNMETTVTASASLSDSTLSPQTNTPTQKCVPPCFYGITPGKTTLDQSIGLLHTYSSHLVSFALHLVDGEIWWSTQPSAPSNKLYFNSKKIVETILSNEQSGSTFGDIVQRYGPPNLVIIGSPGGGMPLEETYFVYSSLGLAFGAVKDASSFLDQPTDRYIPAPNMLVTEEVYFAPDTVDVISNLNAWSGFVTDKRGIRTWRGFGVSYYEP